ncbi:C-factor [Alteripontixanthobacter maritimus]|uniref:C-factor n=1 Tax=Alteripontixanthobacter maritimus TaxID=2161824 RepID=A0A369QAX8_9SPHN|nr:SDR family NAD(P)-dependent oxidoreductase [Alteripontixanthobacter maritimus]RDC60069.1 C-factor [Alteripontixanthobacter maritimus]
MSNPGTLPTACVFGASGGIGSALVAGLVASGRFGDVFAGSRTGDCGLSGANDFAFDLLDESSIAAAAGRLKDTAPQLVIVATGSLTLPGGAGPEKSLRSLDPKIMGEMFALNTIGPAIIAKHFLPLLPRSGRSVFAALSARVGSISDNGLGGWHSYRASKAALNMMLRNFAIETARTRKEAIVVGLHPGTVDTRLSKPFQGNVPDAQLFTPAKSAACLIDVIDGLTPKDTGYVFDWRGERIPA